MLGDLEAIELPPTNRTAIMLHLFPIKLRLSGLDQPR